MAIKKTVLLSKEDFENALVELRLSVSEVARETGLPRQYISHFRTYGDGLKPEQVAKVRDYLETKLAENGMALESTPETEDSTPVKLVVALPNVDAANLRRSSLTCLHFYISPDIPEQAIIQAVRRMEENEARIEELMGREASRPDFFGSGQWSGQTEADLQEAIALMAENFVIARLLQERNFMTQGMADRTEVKTVRDVLTFTFGSVAEDFFSNLLPVVPAVEPEAEEV
jgi:hypothetical protein